MTEWGGLERRTEHCDMHIENSKALQTAATEIHAIKIGIFIGRWVIGLILTVVVVVAGATLSEIKDSIKTIEGDIKVMLPVESRVERLERTVEYNSNVRITELEKYKHEHSK